MSHAINWFEIPANDLDRAKAFYETVLDLQMIVPFPGMKYAMFPSDPTKNEIGGGIMEEAGFEPSEKGSLIYLNGGDDLDIPLSRVEAAGGRVIMPKTAIGANGFMARFIDTEGNRVAFHSRK